MRRHHVLSRTFVVAAATLALVAAVPQGRVAHASDYTALARQAGQAIAATRSNLMVNDLTAGDTTIHMEMIRVGQGAQASFYLKEQFKDKTGSHAMEIEVTAKQSCFKMQTTWRCTSVANMTSYQALLNNPFLYATQEAKLPAGSSLNVTPLGFKTIQGQGCVGYRIVFTSSKPPVQGFGQFWIVAASKLPVEEDLHAAGKTPFTMRVVWSNWNDPTLRLPPVPAA